MRLIDADALTEVLNVKKNCEDCDYQQGMFCSKSSDFVNACEAIFDAPTIEPEPHWIPCSERLPEEFGDYLVSIKRIGWNCEEYIENDIAYYDDLEGFHKADKVIAWMPLPEPYAERKTDGEEIH